MADVKLVALLKTKVTLADLVDSLDKHALEHLEVDKSLQIIKNRLNSVSME